MDFRAAATAASMAGNISCPAQSHCQAKGFGAAMIHRNFPDSDRQATFNLDSRSPARKSRFEE
jgi:hypothetical protein